MSESHPPMASAELRTRIAVPVDPPHLRPSLIPHDVMQELEREARRDDLQDESGEMEPSTAPVPVPDDVPIFTEATAELEVALCALQQVALFKDLPKESLAALAQDAMQLELPDGELLFVEGDEATSFFITLDGTLELLRHKEDREVALRHVGAGEALGLFGLFSAQLRAASARAIGDCVVLQLSGESLRAVLEQDDALHDRLLQFYRERLLESFMSNRLFGEIDSIARARLIGRFQNKTWKQGEVVLSPGEVSNLLLVVTHGTLILEERQRIGASRHFEVQQGQFLVVTSALSGIPGRMRIFAPEDASVSMLTHKDLNELFRDYPALRVLPARLPGFARTIDRDVFCGATGIPGL